MTRITIRPEFKNESAAIEAIMEAYDNGATYFYGSVMGRPFKIRMNKDHNMKSYNNSDCEHMLSLVQSENATMLWYDNISGYFINQEAITDRDSVQGFVEYFIDTLIRDYENEN